MTLILSILRCPDNVPPQTRTLTGGELSIGRGPENDWVLPDPDRVLSKRHCVVAFRQGGWQVADVSSNGTYFNREADPIGPGRVQELRDGDRLRLGTYELELRLEEAAGPGLAGPGFGGFGGGNKGTVAADPFAADPFGDDPFAPARPVRSVNPFAEDSLLQPPGGGLFQPGVTLPPDFDPLAPGHNDAPFSGPTQPDHTPSVADAFRPPTVSRIPDDWDLDFAQPPAPPNPAAAAFVQPTPPRALPLAPPPPLPLAPTDDAFSPFDEPTPAPPPAAPVRAPVPQPEAAGPLPPPLPEPAPKAAKPPTAAPQPAPPALAPDAELMAAFLRGAGLEDARPADPVIAMERLGSAFRAVVSGIRHTLIARAAVKSEFRIEQTMIRARGNNPLKFSAGDDDALAALIGAGRRSDMLAAEAIADAMRDIRLHELATMAAMQTAVRALLKRLDPQPLREEGEKAGGMLAAQRRARAFELYEKLYIDISHALADDFDSVFGKAFARAYEQALREASAKEHS